MPSLPRLSSLTRLLPHGARIPSSVLRRAGTPRGQLLGVSLIAVPAVTNALPLSGAPRTLLQVVAVVVGTFGAVVVFGGLVQRTVLGRPNIEAGAGEDGDEDARPDVDSSPVDAALLAVPHARTVWLVLALLSAVLLAGALASLVMVFGRDAGRHLTDALMLALPGLVLGWATWQARVMRIVPDQSAEPLEVEVS